MQQQSNKPLVGSPNESDVIVNNISTKALLDTGSTVSTVSEHFYKNKLTDVVLNPLDVILKIECADGQQLPYLGYIEVEIEAIGAGIQKKQPCLLLVVPDSDYNSQVPLLLGTNVLTIFLNECKSKHGNRFLQGADIHTPWYLAFRCMLLQDRELSRQHFSLGKVRSLTSKRLLITANSGVVVQGYVDKPVNYRSTCAVIQPTKGSVIPDDIDIVPTIVNYCCNSKMYVDVHISNITTRTISIPPRALLCELQAVTVEKIPDTLMNSEIGSEVLLNKINFDESSVTSEGLERGKKVICQFHDIFSTDDNDIGHTTAVTHKIELYDEQPFKQRCRRIPPAMYEEVKDHLQQLLASGVIRRSHSPWSSNIVLVRKKDGKLRMCVDYRQLNRLTIKDSYSIPRIEEMFDALSGSKYYSTLDMKSGYHQVEIEESHKERTAFSVGPLGFYEYNRMPFGLCNSPATYQRLMNECFEGLHLKICLIYLDDIIVFSDTYEEHLSRLQQVFQRIRETGMKLSPKKCSFFKTRIRFLGHVVSEQGIEADGEKIQKIKDWPTPRNPNEVRQFLGFAGYYRKFVKDFAKIAKPLNALMPSTKSKRNCKTSDKPWEWGPSQEESFHKLKYLLSSPPVLGYADYSKPFELHTDASTHGLGAVLYQEQDGVKRVISYASRGLSKSEANYSAHRLEFLALKWAVTEKFHDYLYGNTFTVYTDNNPLTYILTSAKLDATGHRWLAALAAYNFDIVYRSGLNNADADGLSRLPGVETCDLRCTQMDSDSVKAICNVLYSQPFVQSLCLSADAVDDNLHEPALHGMKDRDWRMAQHADNVLRPWIECVRLKKKPSLRDFPHTWSNSFHKSFHNLVLLKGVLYRKVNIDGQERCQLVLPAAYVNDALKGLHNDIGHPGKGRTLSLLRDRFYWPGMSHDVEYWIRQCDRCLRRKSPTNARAPLVSITSSQPLELVCMDFLTLETSKGGYQHILVITDHFTRYAQAIPTKNMTAKTTAEVFFNNFVVHYGIPKRIHSDQGANFESRLLKELCNILGVEKSRTTSYHPMGNGMCERFNRTLLDMLGTLQPDQKKNWKQFVAPLVHAYNCIRHESTNQSPFLLMFGREPRLPIDLAFGIETNKPHESLLSYTKSLKERMQQSYELAAKISKVSQQRQKSGYDLKVRGATLQEGDRVLVKILAFDGKHKLADHWEEFPYVVLLQPNKDIPVFVVQREDGVGRKRTLHRNHLLPIGTVPTENKNKPTPKPRKRKPQPEVQEKAAESESEQEDLDVVLYTADDDSTIVTQNAVGVDESTLTDTGDDQHSVEVDGDVPDGDDHVSDNFEVEGTGTDPFVNDVDDLNPDVDSPEGESPTVSPIRLRPQPPPRRSVRTHRKPQWMESGNYAMSQINTDFMDKSNLIKQLAILSIIDGTRK